MNETIRLDGMRFFTRHGALPHEATVPQAFEVTVTLEAAIARATKSDRIADTVNYAAAYERVREVMEGPRCNLLERLAGRIAEQLLDLPKVEAVTVTVRKAAPPLPGPLEGVEVTITRRA